MTSGRTWSAKDLDPRTRQMAEEAARLSGMTLEEWLSETVAQRAGGVPTGEPPVAAPTRRSADVAPGNIAATLARLGERIRSITPQVRHVRDAAQKAELEQITERLARDLQDIDEAARSKIEGREGSEEAAPAAGLEVTLRNIELEMADLARRTRAETEARRDAQYDEIRERLEALRQPRARRAAAPPPDLDDTLRDIEAEMMRAEPPSRPARQPPPEAPPRPEIPRAPPPARPEAKSLSAAIADIASRQSFLAGRPPPPEESTPAAIGALRAEVAVLSDRLAILNDRGSEERAGREGAMLRAEKAALAGQSSMSTIASMLGDIRVALVGLNARPPAPAPAADLGGLVTGMDDLRRRVDGLERTGRQGVEALQRIEARVESVSRIDPVALIKGIEDRLDGLAARIEVAINMPSRDGSLDEVKAEIAAMRRDLASRGAVDAGLIEKRIRDLVEQMGATARSDDGGQLAALEARVEGLAADLGRATPRAAALEEVEQRLARLKESVAEGRKDCVEAAQDAARKAVRDLGAGSRDDGLVSELRKDLDEVRKLIKASGRSAPLDETAVKAQLFAVASRIDSLVEAEAPGGAAAPGGDSPAREPAPARPRRDLGIVREVEASASEDRVSVDRRADFIAAARRAVHVAMAETRSATMPDHDSPVLAAAGAGSPFARIGQAIRARRRPLLLVAAALVVAIGALQMFGRPMADGETSADADGVVFVNGSSPPAVAQASAAAVAALPDDGVAIPVVTRSAAPRQIDGVDPYVTGSTQPAPPEPMPDVGSDELRVAAMAGDPAAAYRIANLYADGRGTLRDLAKAAVWYQRAAEAGMTPAIYRLASLYERGQGVPRDVGKAITLYRDAAERGNPGAMYNLAVLLSAGAAGAADTRKALDWFHAAADHGVTDSQYNLGVIYARGIGVPANREDAYTWFAIAAAAGDQDAVGERDQIAATLSPAQLARARAAAAAFVPRSAPQGASEKVVLAGAAAAAATPVPAAAAAQVPTDADARREMVRSVQVLLAARGYDPGPADGLEGPRTKQAVRAFQRSIGAPGTGRIDGTLVVSLDPRAG